MRRTKSFCVILPNPWASAYSNVAELCNRFNVSCRNLHTFNMDEWANEDGEVAPLTYTAGLGYSFRKYFYGTLRKDLRPAEDHMHYFTTKNVNDYSKIIAGYQRRGRGRLLQRNRMAGPYRLYRSPYTEEFKADTLEEFLEMGSRLVTQHPLTVAENSLFGIFGCSGDVANVPPKAATIGPRDIKYAKDRFEMHSLASLGGREHMATHDFQADAVRPGEYAGARLPYCSCLRRRCSYPRISRCPLNAGKKRWGI